MERKRDKMMDFCMLMMESSGFNIPAPESFLGSKSAKLLPNPDAQSVWLDLQIAMSKATPKEFMNLIRMMILKYVTVLDVIRDLRDEMIEDNRELLEFIKENDKYRLSEDERPDSFLIQDRLRRILDGDD